MTSQVTRLEDFCVRGATSPVERLKEYQVQAKDLPKTRKARFWLEVLKHDKEVAKLVKENEVKNARRKGRSS